MLHSLLLAAAALPALAMANSFPVTTLDQLSLGVWLENIAIRPNGDILITEMAPTANIYTIQNPSGNHSKFEKFASFPSVHSVIGVSELPKRYEHDSETYVVVGANTTGLAQPITGTFSAWTIEVSRSRRHDKVQTKKVSTMSSDSTFLNGMTAIPGVSDAVLVADSTLGIVGHLNISSGAFDTSAFVFPEMQPIEGTSLAIGVNGIRVNNGYLYWSNSFAITIYRIAITHQGYPLEGAHVETVANLSNISSFIDDFNFDANGNIYAANVYDNTISFLDVNTSKAQIVAGALDSMAIAGGTSLEFGRGKYDKDTFYVATSGAIASPVRGNRTEGAKVVSVDTGVHFH